LVGIFLHGVLGEPAEEKALSSTNAQFLASD
jgi:hypothetical protein